MYSSVWLRFSGGEGVVDGKGKSLQAVKDAWSGVVWGGVGSLRDLSRNILKQGVGKGKSC